MTSARSGASRSARWLARASTLQLLLAALLAGNLFLGGSWLGKGTFDDWLMGGLWLTAGVGLVAGIYAFVSLVRRSQPISLCLWLIAATVLAALCYFAMFAFIALHTSG